MTEERRKLYRSREDKMVAGVLGGAAEHWNVDPAIVRVAFAFFTVMTGVVPGIILYLLAMIIVPAEPKRAGG